MIVLLSENSVESANVLKEVSLASERRKPILPVILRSSPVPDALQYHLAGIHYLYYSDHSAIVRSLKGTPQGSSIRDFRKSILVLPFDDLSPANDNGWFADGLTAELISMLSKIKSLRVIDRSTSMEFKQFRGRTKDMVKELSVRYFLEGSVRKFGDQIKINVELLDTKDGNYLWHDEYKGIFSDIFEIQERVAKRVFEGLEVTLSRDEQKKVSAHGTDNAEAYELYLRALKSYHLWTHENMLHTIRITDKIIALDQQFAEALRLKALALCNLYRLWDRNLRYLDEADSLFEKSQTLRPDLNLRDALIVLLMLQNKFKVAEALVQEGIREAPHDFNRYFSAGFYYNNSGQIKNAIKPYEDALRLNPKNKMTYWNLTEALDRLHRNEERKKYSLQALPHFERWLVLHPEDQFARAQLATFQLYTGEKEKALKTVEPLTIASDVDGLALYTVAVLFMHLGETETAMATLERAVGAGFSHIELLKSDPNFDPVAETERFLAVLDRMALSGTEAPATTEKTAV